MVDKIIADDNKISPDGVDFDAELQKSRLPSDTCWWFWAGGWITGTLSIGATLMGASWIILAIGLCFSAIFFGFGFVINRLDEILSEIRRK